MSEPKRLFFAIDLPDDARAQIIAWRAAHFASEDGRPVAAANLHLTLAFLGDVSNDKQCALVQLAGRIRQPGFTLHLDDAGQWLRSRVVWLGMRQPPRGLLQLANAARAGRPQRLLPKPAAFSPAYYAAARRQPYGGYPAAGLLLVISGHIVCALRLFVWARPYPLCRTAALDAERIIIKECRCYSHPLYNALR